MSNKQDKIGMTEEDSDKRSYSTDTKSVNKLAYVKVEEYSYIIDEPESQPNKKPR